MAKSKVNKKKKASAEDIKKKSYREAFEQAFPKKTDYTKIAKGTFEVICAGLILFLLLFFGYQALVYAPPECPVKEFGQVKKVTLTPDMFRKCCVFPNPSDYTVADCDVECLIPNVCYWVNESE